MPRYLNHYVCPNCDYAWDDEWSCMVDDECGECGTGDISPTESELLDGCGAEEDA